jgi:hypothetical protein
MGLVAELHLRPRRVTFHMCSIIENGLTRGKKKEGGMCAG